MPVHTVPRDEYEDTYKTLTRSGEDVVQITFAGDEAVFLTVYSDRVETR